MKVARYFVVGGVAALIDIGIFAIFAIYFELNYLVVSFFSFTVATFVNYFLSIKYVFSGGIRFSRNREILAIFLVSGIGLFLNQAILYIGVSLFTLDKLLTKVFANGAVFFWNYSVRSLYIFSNKTRNK